MEKSSYLSCPSFWKLLSEDDFNRGIRIPHSFSNHLEIKKSPCNFSLITGDKKTSSDHRSWRAKLVKKNHYFYLCKKSWPEFVKHHSLKYGDFLLFHLVDETTFRVTPYSANGSVKKKLDVSGSSSDDDDDDSDTRESESDDDGVVRTSAKRRQERGRYTTPVLKKVKTEQIDSYEVDEDEPRGPSRRSVGKIAGNYGPGGGVNKEVDEYSRKQIERISSADEASKWDHYYDLGVEKPYFIRTIKQGHKFFVVTPRPFARAMNLNKVKEVELQWEDGDRKRTWTANMLHADVGRVDIGWSEFRRRFDIRVGETCRFSVSHGRENVTVSVHVYRFGGDQHKSRN